MPNSIDRWAYDCDGLKASGVRTVTHQDDSGGYGLTIAVLIWVWGMCNGPAPAFVGRTPWIRNPRSETALATELVFMHLVVDAAWRDPEKSGRLRLIASRFLQSGL
jgi:hypothetical protein